MSEELRILHAVISLEPGGMENGVVNVANRLHGRGFSFSVACIEQAGRFSARLPPGVEVKPLGKASGFSVGTVARLSRLIRETRPHLLHTHNLGPLIYGAGATRLGRALPILHGEHAQLTPAEQRGRRWLQRRLLYRCCRMVHTVAESQLDELVRLRLARRSRLLAVVNGVDADRFRPSDRHLSRAFLGLPRDARVLGLVGRFGRFKRHAETVRAFVSIARRIEDLHLVLAGDGGPEKEAVLAAIDRSDFRGRIHWIGHRDDLERCYPALDLLVVPSINEGLSNAVLESMACGIPVLASRACGNAEAIRDGVDGLVRDLGDEHSLAGEIETAIAGDLATMGRLARVAVEERFSLEGMAQRYASLYRRVAYRGGSGVVD